MSDEDGGAPAPDGSGTDGASAADLDATDEPEAAYPEPDPEADLADPESELPTVPSVDVPTPPRPGGDAPPALRRGFWTTVLVFDVALLATSVGAMMLAFGVERPLGAGLLAVGLLSLFRGYRKYRALDRRQRDGDWTDANDEQAASADADERNG